MNNLDAERLHGRDNQDRLRRSGRLVLTDWLQERDRSDPATYSHFAVADVAEVVEPTASIEGFLRTKMAEGRFDPGFLVAAAQEMGWENVSRLFSAGQPTSLQARRGYFGEILSAALARDMRGYAIPVAKFRFAPNPNVSPAGTDVLAVRVTDGGEVAEVCLIEAKLRTGASRSVAVEGVAQLIKDRSSEIPNITRFVLERLHETGHELFPAFARYLGSRSAEPALESSRLYLVFDRQAWSETGLADLDASELRLEELTVHVTLIERLGPLTERLFAALGVQDLVDD